MDTLALHETEVSKVAGMSGAPLLPMCSYFLCVSIAEVSVQVVNSWCSLHTTT